MFFFSVLFLSFFLPVRLNLRGGHQTGFGMQVQSVCVWGGGEREASGVRIKEVRFVQAQDQQVVTTYSPRIITECLLTRSMLIKMYVHAINS